MNFLERVMRVMTHINIGIALGLVAWVLWLGWQVADGQIVPARRVAEVNALLRVAQAGPPAPMQLLAAHAAGGAPAACPQPHQPHQPHQPLQVAPQAFQLRAGADL